MEVELLENICPARKMFVFCPVMAADVVYTIRRIINELILFFIKFQLDQYSFYSPSIDRVSEFSPTAVTRLLRICKFLS